MLVCALYLSAFNCVQVRHLSRARDLFKKAAPSVVYISFMDPEGQPYHGGTGFQVEDPSGKSFIVTNAHVCHVFAPNNAVIIKTEQGKFFFRHILQVSDLFDLCVIDSIEGMPSLKLAKKLDMHQHISILGHPLLQPLKITSGKVDGSEIIITTEDGLTPSGSFVAMRTGAESKPGNSGSPVIDDNGYVVGVLFAGNGVESCFVPLEDLKNFLP
jgi:S1-C subfamily serine protease